MLDIKFIRENKEIIELGAKKKHVKIDIGELIELDDKRRHLLSTIEKKRAEQNIVGQRIVHANDIDRAKFIESMKHLKAGLEDEEESLKKTMKKWQDLMLQVPNMPDISVPEGENEDFNKEIKAWGEKTVFDLGAGINGFSYGYFSKLGYNVSYTGVEAVGQLVNLTNYYFKAKKIEREFTSTVNHTFRTPLTRIGWISKELEKRGYEVMVPHPSKIKGVDYLD